MTASFSAPDACYSTRSHSIILSHGCPVMKMRTTKQYCAFNSMSWINFLLITHASRALALWSGSKVLLVHNLKRWKYSASQKIVFGKRRERQQHIFCCTYKKSSYKRKQLLESFISIQAFLFSQPAVKLLISGQQGN